MSAPIWLQDSADLAFDKRRAKAKAASSVWMATLCSPAARARLLAIGVLTAILIAALALCFGSAKAPGTRNLQSDWAGMIRPDQLPASPQADPVAAASAPAPLLGEQAAAHNAQAPFATLGPASQPFRFAGPLPERSRARACLAAAMLYEAGDDAIGQLAVGQVILNRARHPAYPASVCGVVTQGSDRATGCQFTFTCDGSLARHVSAAARERALAHADLMLDGMVFAGVGLATHYHTVDVYPWWSPRLQKIARVGAHLFFRWPGYWGSTKAVLARRGGSEPSAALFAQFGSAPLPEVGMSSAEPQVAVRTADAAGLRPVASLDQVAAVGTPADPFADGLAAAIPSSRRLPSPAPRTTTHAIMVSAPALEAGRLLRIFPEEGVFFLELAAGSHETSRRRTAELLCGGRIECHVYGWNNAASAPPVMKLDRAARAALAFSYARTPATDRRSLPPSVGAF